MSSRKSLAPRTLAGVSALLVFAISRPVAAQPFTDINAGLMGLSDGAMAWGDYDNDGDLDLAVTGRYYDIGWHPVSKVYRNDGGGAFADINAALTPVSYSTLAWGDYDNDGDLDLALSGVVGQDFSTYVSKVYRNDGGIFTDIGAGLVPMRSGSLAWGDYDNDGDLDLGLAGAAQTAVVAKIYRNDGGVFTDISASLVGVGLCSLAWGDYDNDGDLDLALAGDFVSKIYRNDGNGTFTDIISPLVEVSDASLAWGDYDNDGDLDLALAGTPRSSGGVTKIYRNNGAGVFTDTNAALGPVGGWNQTCSLAWGDCDNDGDLDLAISGYEGTMVASRIYRNDGGTFVDLNAGLIGLANGSLAWGDYDNDGDLDLGIMGATDTAPIRGFVMEVYRNDVASSSAPPAAPSGLSASVQDTDVTFSWVAASDAQTPTAGLSYNLRVGTSPGAADVFSGMADLSSGLRRIPATGNVQQRLSWTVKRLPFGACYWSVQAIDTSFAGSAWAPEQSVTVTRRFVDINAGLMGLADGVAAWGDYDHDGDLDLVVVGGYSIGGWVTGSRLYRNDGNGVFTDVHAPLVEHRYNSAAWGDYDGDGDLDLCVGGRIYHNDGGGFTDINSAVPDLPSGSAVAWGDYDNDGDLDLAVSGFSGSQWEPITRIYRNDGGGTFTNIKADLVAVVWSKLAWCDYDKDGDLDLAVAGQVGDSYVTKVYRNDGLGTFTAINEQFVGVAGGSLAWGDYDNDGYADLAVAGFTGSARVTRLYHNNGNGTFADSGISLPGVSDCTLAWGDYDNDGDLDLVIGGLMDGPAYISRVYRNDGDGVFADINAGLPGYKGFLAAWGDYDRDGDLDLAVGGWDGVDAPDHTFTRIYRNDGGVFNTAPAAPSGLAVTSVGSDVTFRWTAASDAQTPGAALSYNLRVGRSPGAADVMNAMADLSTGLRRVPDIGNAQQGLSWTVKGLAQGTYYWSVQAIDTAFAGSAWAPEQTATVTLPFADIGAVLPGLSDSALAWGDYDNDGHLDLAVAGNQDVGSVAKIYHNDGTGIFTSISAPLIWVGDAALAWGDYDNDGDLDLAVTGWHEAPVSGPVSKIYRNDGGVFADVGAAIIAVSQGALAWGDYDNDGDLDLVLTGYVGPGVGLAGRIYRNDGADVFTDSGVNLLGVYESAVAWGDYDNDGDVDVLLSGNTGGGETVRLYRNDSGPLGASFSLWMTFGGVQSGSLAWGDYDDDGDLDFAFAGITGGGPTCRVFRNNGNSLFTDIYAPVVQVMNASVAWGDFDNDGDLDLAVAGDSGTGGYVSRIYRYDAEAYTFTDIKAGLPGVASGSVAWADYDNDGKLDLVLAGDTGSGRITRIYRNLGAAANMPPTAPSGLLTSAAPEGVVFSWAAATDAQTPSAGLSYNLRVGTSPGGSNVFSGMADLASGLRRLPATGNAQKRLSWTLRGLQAGTYYWSVQAVDSAFAGSPWAPEQTAAVTRPPLNDINAALAGVTEAAVAWGDYDNDGDLDAVIAGTSVTGPVTRVYRNDGGGVLTDISAGLVGVYRGAVAWGDYDRDGDLDLAVAGETVYGATLPVSKIYRNEGGGVFADIGAGLVGVSYSALAWGDYDNDGDLDLVLAGATGTTSVTQLYRNDGGVFTFAEPPGLPALMLQGVSECSLAWGDCDNDGDLDLAVTGRPTTPTTATFGKIYRNDGNGYFSTTTSFVAVRSCSLAWGDYDNDGDLDLAVAGDTGAGYVGKILRNDGTDAKGLVKLIDIGAALTGVTQCSLGWGDYDNDGYLDLAIAGQSATGAVSKVYKNYAGTFGDAQAVLEAVQACSLAWGDYDADGDLDLILAGNAEAGAVTRVYRNDALVANTPPTAPSGLAIGLTVEGVTFSWTAATDAQTSGGGLSYNLRMGTSPGSADVFSGMADLASGLRRLPALGNAQKRLSWTINGLPNATYYWSVQAVDTAFVGSAWAAEQASEVHRPFSNINAGLPGLSNCSLAWGDYDNDGDLDLAVAGSVTPGIGQVATQVTCVYRNNGGVFTDIKAGLAGVAYGSLAWGDYDNDGDLDLAVAGSQGRLPPVTKLYRNDGGGVFADTNAALAGVSFASLAWGDYDNDGDLDLVVAGYAGTTRTSRIYRNDGGGVFTDINAGLAPVAYSALAWGDYDNDGDLDLAVTGTSSDGSTHYVTTIYRNDGGAFVDIGAGVQGLANGGAAWGDYDNDGDLDLAIAGQSVNGPVSKIYRNDGGSFTDTNADLVGVTYGSLAWGDYDNDGRLDLAVAGRAVLQGTNVAISRIYHNDAGDSFTEADVFLPGLGYGSLAWGDYDNDGRLDLAIAGTPLPQSGGGVARIYRNDAEAANTPPTTPGGLAASVLGRAITFSWAAASDSQTPNAGLSHNLRVGTGPGAGDVFSGMADLASGWRRVPATGNAQKRMSATVTSLHYGTYYASVQAIDTSFAGSAWATEQVVIVPAPSDFNVDGDVDLDDFLHFRGCFNGPNRPALLAAPACDDADFDGDEDVDLTDFGAFRSCFNGPNRPPACP